MRQFKGSNITKHRISPRDQITPALIPAGCYLIGSNSIPNASPPHNREVRSFWIDRTVVTFGHFERFVAGGGYDDESLWSDSDKFTTPFSVDQRCEELMEHSLLVSEFFLLLTKYHY